MFSIVIPLYNKQKYIYETIESVLYQSFHNFEIIIVNDGSTDNSINIVNSFADHRIKVYTIQNGGVSNARNFGILNSIYDWIAFLDADDVWESNYLEVAFNLINVNFNFEVLATNYYLKWGVKNNVILNVETGLINSYYNNPCINSSTAIIHRNVFYKIGFFNTTLKYGEDQHLWFRIGSKCKIFFNNSPLVFYRQEDHLLSNKDYCSRDINSDLVSVIYELEIYSKEWYLFREKYVLKYLRPYYICDNHLNSVRDIIKKIPITKKNIMFVIFYLFPRFLIKPIYKFYFFYKYIR